MKNPKHVAVMIVKLSFTYILNNKCCVRLYNCMYILLIIGNTTWVVPHLKTCKFETLPCHCGLLIGVQFGIQKTAGVSNYDAANVLVLRWTEYLPVVGQVLAGPRRSTYGRKLGLHSCSEVLGARVCVCVCVGGGDGTEAIRP